jgi:hypothetical protein
MLVTHKIRKNSLTSTFVWDQRAHESTMVLTQPHASVERATVFLWNTKTTHSAVVQTKE